MASFRCHLHSSPLVSSTQTQHTHVQSAILSCGLVEGGPLCRLPLSRGASDRSLDVEDKTGKHSLEVLRFTCVSGFAFDRRTLNTLNLENSGFYKPSVYN